MSNSKMTRRALLTSIMALMLCFAMLTGTTFAWFTDQETSGNNRIVAGNLDVDFLMYKDSGYTSIAGGVGDIFSEGATANASNATLWEPGATHVAYLAVENKGNLALKYNIALNIKDNGLAEALEYIIVDEYEYTGTSVAKWADLKTQYTAGQVAGGNFIAAPNGKLVPATTDYFALVVHMKEDAGNEYMDKNIVIDVIVQATQLANEEDAFGSDYDAIADFSDFSFIDFGAGSESVDVSSGSVPEITIKNGLGANIGSALIPSAALAAGVEKVNVTFEKTEDNANITIDTGSEAETYEISVEGIKENNTEPITMTKRLAKNLDPDTVKVYHKDQLIDSTYDPNSGYVTFKVTNFSPFTFVYNPTVVEIEKPDASDPVPEANVENVSLTYANKEIDWNDDFGVYPDAEIDSTPMLDSVFKFSVQQTPEQVEESPYRNWYCDFFVSLDKDLTANKMLLGGNYGDFGWVGFHVTEDMLSLYDSETKTLPANVEVPLLGTVVVNNWTYEMVADFVGTFICGVGDVDDALAGATFTVKLRLTNPENEKEYYDVATINHTFTN